MNPFRENAEVNKTEIECTKIREREDTKRKVIEQREQTKREKIKTRGDGLIEWVASTLMVVVVCVTVGVSLSGWIKAIRPPSTCSETVEVINTQDSVRSCPPGGWYETVSDQHGVTVHCHCGPKPGASSTSEAEPKDVAK